MNDHFDVIIIGAGTAGLSALREVRKRTDNFLIINDGPWGSMCARVGCMPSKALTEAASAFFRRGALAEFGIIGANHLEVDLPAVLRRVRKVRDGMVASTMENTSDLGERALSGRAQIRGPNTVTVNGHELHAKQIIIATGAHPFVPEEWQHLGERLLTTDTLFEQVTLPRRIAVLGLGPVGAEVAQTLAQLGLEIFAFDGKTNIAGLTDPVVNACAAKIFRQDFTVHLGHEATVAREGDGVRVSAGRESVVVDKVVVALGRRPSIDGLGLEHLGLPLNAFGLPEVDPTTIQVGKLPVFLCGDVYGDRPIQHETADEGHIAGLNATGARIKHFVRRTPLAIVFVEPNIAVVGERFSALESAQIKIGEATFDNQGRTRLGQTNEGVVRIYADGDGLIRGAELCAPEGEHLAHLLAHAISRSATVTDLLRMPFYHPTVEEGLRTALRKIGSGEFELPFAAQTAPVSREASATLVS